MGRGIGLWGDMVVVLKNGDKVELRAVPRLGPLPPWVSPHAFVFNELFFHPGVQWKLFC